MKTAAAAKVIARREASADGHQGVLKSLVLKAVEDDNLSAHDIEKLDKALAALELPVEAFDNAVVGVRRVRELLPMEAQVATAKQAAEQAAEAHAAFIADGKGYTARRDGPNAGAVRGQDQRHRRAGSARRAPRARARPGSRGRPGRRSRPRPGTSPTGTGRPLRRWLATTNPAVRYSHGSSAPSGTSARRRHAMVRTSAARSSASSRPARRTRNRCTAVACSRTSASNQAASCAVSAARRPALVGSPRRRRRRAPAVPSVACPACSAVSGGTVLPGWCRTKAYTCHLCRGGPDLARAAVEPEFVRGRRRPPR